MIADYTESMTLEEIMDLWFGVSEHEGVDVRVQILGLRLCGVIEMDEIADTET